MRHGRAVAMAVIVGLATLSGCSKPAGQDPTTGTTDEASAGLGAVIPGCLNPPKSLDGPEGAVCQFLEAIRTGDDQKTEAMFVSQARQKIKELQIPVTPRGSDTARFQIGQVQYLGDDGARVACRWTDLDRDGERRTDEMTWMLRKEGEGWRIAGMAATVFEGEDPLVLDFENPEEVVARLERLREEIVARASKQGEQAQRSEDSPSPIQR
jgi:hypothetical protein